MVRLKTRPVDHKNEGSDPRQVAKRAGRFNNDLLLTIAMLLLRSAVLADL